MKCPRCGADNAEQAEWCYLCEYPFAGGTDPVAMPPTGEGDAARPPAADGTPYRAPGPPPVAPTAAYGPQPPPPGALPPGFGPVPAKRGVSSTKAGIGLAVGLVVIIAGLLSFFLLRGKTYTINVPVPPGYARADEKMMDEAKKSLQETAEGVVLDEAFIDEVNTNFVFVLHRDVPFSDAPSGKDPEEMERYFYEHKDEWVEAFASGIVESGPELSPQLEKYEVLRMDSGDAALHMTTSLGIQQYSFTVDTLWIIKESSAFAVVVEGLDPRGEEVIEFLLENITFK